MLKKSENLPCSVCFSGVGFLNSFVGVVEVWRIKCCGKKSSLKRNSSFKCAR